MHGESVHHGFPDRFAIQTQPVRESGLLDNDLSRHALHHKVPGPYTGVDDGALFPELFV